MATASSLTHPEWPRLDLAKHRATNLSMQFAITLTPEVETAFAGMLDDDGDFLGVLVYSRGRVRHAVRELVAREVGDPGSLDVYVEFDASDRVPSGSVPKPLRRQGELLHRLGRLGGTPAVHCHASFEYRSDLDVETIFPLPTRFGPFHDTPFPVDEIRGVRGVKLSEGGDGKLSYSFILDRPRNDDVNLSIFFDLAGGPAEQTAERAFRFALDVAQSVVFEGRR